MNLNSMDCEVFDSIGYFAIKDSEIIDDTQHQIVVQCKLQGNCPKESIEQYLSQEQGRKVILREI